MMAGLNTDPTTDETYLGIDYVWYMQYGTAYTRIPGSGANRQSTSYTPADVLSIQYDGAQVFFYKNGVLIDSAYVTVGVDPQKLYFDSSFYEPNGFLYVLAFGPAGTIGPQGAPGVDEIGSAHV